MRILPVATYATIAVLLVACSGGLNAPLPDAAQTASRADGAPRRPTQGRVTLSWKASSSKAASRLRGPHFVAPGAQSIQIDAVSIGRTSKGTSTIVNRPKAGTESTVTFAVPAGEDRFYFTVFDKKNASGSGIGGAQIVRTMAAGKTTAIGVTLDAYIAKATFVSGAGKEFLKTSADGSSYTLVGTAPVALTVTFMDEDGNVILPAQSDAQISLTISEPSLIAFHHVAGSSNGFTIQATEPDPASTPITIDLQVSSGASGSQIFSQQYAIRQDALLFAAAAGSPGSVTLFDQEGNTYAAAGGFPGLQDPIAVAWDNDDGVLFVADSGRHAILAYDGSGNSLKGWTDPSVPGITSIAYNRDRHRIYATAAQSAGAPHDAVLAFDLQGRALRVRGFAQATGPVSIAYGNYATMNDPETSDEFWIIATSSSGVTTLRAYSTYGAPVTFKNNGQNVTSEVLNASGFTPAAVTAQWPSFVTYGSGEIGGTGDDSCTIVGTYNGQGALDIGLTPVTGIGLQNPRVAVNDPLYDYDPGIGVYNQPVEYYIANGKGGLVAVGYAGLTFQRITTVAFPPPAGATSFSALDVTF